MIYVCSLDEMPELVRDLRPEYLISVVEPDWQPPTPPEISPERHLRIEVHDIGQPVTGYIAPEEHHIATLIDFLSACEDDSSVLLHCFAGISRSPAAALIALVLDTEGQEAEAARALRRAAPHAYPNRRMIELADGLLGRSGRLMAAVDAMGPGEFSQFGPLVELPRRP
jgi:predicted protein tyrosine phosphatase